MNPEVETLFSQDLIDKVVRIKVQVRLFQMIDQIINFKDCCKDWDGEIRKLHDTVSMYGGRKNVLINIDQTLLCPIDAEITTKNCEEQCTKMAEKLAESLKTIVGMQPKYFAGTLLTMVGGFKFVYGCRY